MGLVRVTCLVIQVLLALAKCFMKNVFSSHHHQIVSKSYTSPFPNNKITCLLITPVSQGVHSNTSIHLLKSLGSCALIDLGQMLLVQNIICNPTQYLQVLPIKLALSLEPAHSGAPSYIDCFHHPHKNNVNKGYMLYKPTHSCVLGGVWYCSITLPLNAQ